MSEIRRAKQQVARYRRAVERAQEKWALADIAEDDAIRRNESGKVLVLLSARVAVLNEVYNDKMIQYQEAVLELAELEEGGMDMESEEE